MWLPQHLDWQPFASPHLTTIHLHRVQLYALLDFSCCRALLNLTLHDCLLDDADGAALVSPWLERLNIMGCDIPINSKRDSPLGMRIATPRLRYLHLSDSEDYYEWSSRNCTAPMSLESMPLLTSASIQLVGSTTIHMHRR
jgi:hypothetical protein